MSQTAALVPSLLALAIVADIVRMSLTILAGIVGMVGSPLLLAVTADLTIEGIGPQLLAMVGLTAPLLTSRLAADALSRTKHGRDKQLAAVRTDTTHLDRSG